ncbi:hypothetical protein ACRALDRAFT_2106899 [Sodiomyces alcalophilus JCM 7366]|uniref:uncharacterized protein n=1 Tax=Sodiomyces alcalophilus JCM 7366 TaxID=591952 RepID=UPI0039B529C0
MASIARCVRAARPSVLSTLSKPVAATSRPVFYRPVHRRFSATPITEVRKYTKDHEWIDLHADNKTAVIGISEYAAEALGDVVYVELPEEGASVAKGDSIGAVESVKSASDINAPVSLRIVQTNIELEEKPAKINRVPEDDAAGGGWLARVEIEEEGLKEFEELLDLEAYKEFTATLHD